MEPDFFLGIGLIFAASTIAGALALKARLSPIVGFIAVGALIGPSGLNLVPEGPMLDLFAEIGILLLLFVVGVEFEVEKISSVGPAMITVGLLQTSLSFLMGYLAGLALGWPPLSSMYLGGALMFSSTAIIVKMLQDMGYAGTPEYEASVGVLVLQDAMAVMLLIILLNAAATGGASLDVVATTLAKTLTFITLAVAMGVKAVPYLLEKVSRLKMPEAPLLTALSLAFLVAYAAKWLGVSAAVGAFTAGLTIAYSPNAKLIRDVVSPLKDFFMTVFFVSIGTLIALKPSQLIDVALLTAGLLALIVASRVVGCSIGGLMGGLSEPSSLTVAAMLVPIGEFSFIIAKQGAELGLLPSTLFPALVSACVVTTIMAPPLIKRMPDAAIKAVERQPTLLRAMSTFLGRVLGGSFKHMLQSRVHFDRFKERVKSMALDAFLVFIAFSVVSLLKPYLIALHASIPQLQVIGAEAFILVVTAAAVAYPLLDLLMDADKVVNMLTLQALARYPRLAREGGSVKRVVRNFIFAPLLIALMVLLAPGLSTASNMPNLSMAASLIITGLILLLIFDAALVLNKGLWRAVREALRPHATHEVS